MTNTITTYADRLAAHDWFWRMASGPDYANGRDSESALRDDAQTDADRKLFAAWTNRRDTKTALYTVPWKPARTTMCEVCDEESSDVILATSDHSPVLVCRACYDYERGAS